MNTMIRGKEQFAELEARAQCRVEESRTGARVLLNAIQKARKVSEQKEKFGSMWQDWHDHTDRR